MFNFMLIHMYFEYALVLKYFFIALIIALLLFSISFFLVYQQADFEKISSYECGFILLEMLEVNLRYVFIQLLYYL